MDVCVATIKGRPVMLELRDGIVSIDGEAQPIKNLTEQELAQFRESVEAIPPSADPGYEALVNARRAAFLASLLGRAVGDDCLTRLTDLLDHVHYEVLRYLGETGEDD